MPFEFFVNTEPVATTYYSSVGDPDKWDVLSDVEMDALKRGWDPVHTGQPLFAFLLAEVYGE